MKSNNILINKITNKITNKIAKNKLKQKMISILAAITLVGLFCGCQKVEEPAASTQDITRDEVQGISAEVPASEPDAVQNTDQNAEPDAVQNSDLSPEPASETVPENDMDSNLEDTDLAILGSDNVEIYQVPNPSLDYFMSDLYAVADRELIPLQFVKVTEEANQIVDTEAWFAANKLPAFKNEDEAYRYDIINNGNIGQYSMEIYDKNTNQLVIAMDFSEYGYANDFQEKDRPYIDQNINAVKRKDSILYVSTGHYTYAQSSPHTSYITAIDLKAKEVIWKSEPLVNNARCFELIDDIIVCGYGFTAEDDYLIQLDAQTGKVLDKQLLKSAPQYIIKKEDLLYVRTYNTNYTFKIQ